MWYYTFCCIRSLIKRFYQRSFSWDSSLCIVNKKYYILSHSNELLSVVEGCFAFSEARRYFLYSLGSCSVTLIPKLFLHSSSIFKVELDVYV